MEQEFAAIAKIDPENLTEIAQNLEKLYADKRWYEFGELLISLFQMPVLFGHRMEIYQSLILEIGERYDPFHLATIIISVADEIADPHAGIDFLNRSDVNRPFKQEEEFHWLLDIRRIQFLVDIGDSDTARKKLLEVQANLTDQTPLVVRAAACRVHANIDKQAKDYESFYLHGMMTLSAQGTIKDPVLAYDLAVAALLAPSVCSYTELTSQGILDCLVGTNHEWLKDFLVLLSEGDENTVDIYNERFKPRIIAEFETYPNKEDCYNIVYMKVAVSVFLEMVIRRSFDSRTFTFDEIAKKCHLDKKEVEILVVKALASDIIKGNIDECAEQVIVTWCKPKGLGNKRLVHMKGELDHWLNLLHDHRLALEQRSQPVLG